MKFIQAQSRLAIYLFFLTLVGMVLVFLVTHRFGPGVSTDGARYLSTAQNLIEGRGFYDYLNNPLTQFPPLYSIIIAAMSLLSGLDVFVAGQYLNILTFGLVIWLAGYYSYRIFPKEPWFAYVGSAIFATSLSLIIMASNILSDLLFLAFILGFLIVATDILESGAANRVVLLGVIAGLSAFQRYAGLTLGVTGAFLVFLLHRKNIWKGILWAGGFGLLTTAPIVLWVMFHNYVRTGILFGERLPPVYWGNLQVTVEKAAYWFLPLTLTRIIPLWAIALILLLLLITGNRLMDWRRWINSLTTSAVLPSLTFFILYLCVLVFNVSYFEVRYLYMDRIHIMILPALLTLIFVTIRELTPKYLRNRPPRSIQTLATVVFIIWLSYPFYNIQNYVRKAYYEGETSEFNMYNIPALRDSGIKEFFLSHPIDPSLKVYSNYEAAAWFLTRQPITKLPHGPVGEKRVNAQEVLKEFPSWPGKDGPGYVIWIKALSFKPYVLEPSQLTERGDFQLLHLSKGGNIYLLTPK